ncbi:hypothetical protein K1I86_07050 [Streptococcus cristatus]|uniref:hypothetical protein n=1 Tax=Streptococcus cristatus TaxID=45634 RepID=UPI001CBB77B4|nr:hypothetical protein [Streptococcus cristatus]MBZ2152450.1 hypothetical protein [Streptococcus cristatus]
MSGLYFEVKSQLRKEFNLWHDIVLKLFEVILLLLVISFVFTLATSNQYVSGRDLVYIGIYFFVHRSFMIFRKNKIINTALNYGRNSTLTKADVEKLLIEIQKSINHSRDLIKWGMGIFATVMIAFLSITSTLFSKMVDLAMKSISEKEMSDFLEEFFTNSTALDYLKFIFLILTIVVMFLLIIYIILDLFTYDRRFTYGVLINFQYDAFQSEIIEGKSKWTSLKEVFFIDYFF